MPLSHELKRLGTQSAIYGLGGVISRLIAIFLIPVYTVYLGRVGAESRAYVEQVHDIDRVAARLVAIYGSL